MRLFLFSLALLSLLSCVASRLSNSTSNKGSQYTQIQQLPGWSGALRDTMYTGYLDIADGYDSQLFFWLAEPRTPSKVEADTPVILWLQGGPGCSGGLGWFYEFGPYNLQIDDSLTYNDYAWNNNAWIWYIDQPIGTGLSTLSPQGNNQTYVTTIQQQTASLYTALQEFYALFPDLQNNPLYVMGESYGGKYVPYLCTTIMNDNNKKMARGDNNTYNLQGIAIGNGWVHPLTQTSVYVDQAFMLGLIDTNEVNDLNLQFNNCTQLTNSQQWAQAQVVCDNVLNNIADIAGNINIDDVREWVDDEHDPRLENYLSNPAVQSAIHLINPPQQYESCSLIVGDYLATDEMMNSVQLLPDLIKNYRFLLYEGSFDLNCGVAGVEKYLNQLFPDIIPTATKYLWYQNDDASLNPSGYVRNFAALPNLTFLVVQDAGHMMPKSQPVHALDMLTRFLNNEQYPPIPPPSLKHPGHRTRRVQKHHALKQGHLPTTTRVPF